MVTWPMRIEREEEPPLRPRMKAAPRKTVVLLGAGASAAAGCPLIRDFVDMGRDLLRAGALSSRETDDANEAIAWYRLLQGAFRVTEEDIENIESLLSLADLLPFLVGSRGRSIPNALYNIDLMVRREHLQWLHDVFDRYGGSATGAHGASSDLPAALRRFISFVVFYAVRLPPPDAPDWVFGGRGAATAYKRLGQALAYRAADTTVISLNYDCVMEYVFHCLGLGFTYGRRSEGGVEILKLHGSANWVWCDNPECDRHGKLGVAGLAFRPAENGGDDGFIEPNERDCPRCGRPMTPLIVPPTWHKSIDHPSLKQTWRRAFEALEAAEVLVTIGYSLPVSDTHVRQLLSLGLASGALRQALAVLGSDQAAEQRWMSLFRPHWRDARLETRCVSMEAPGVIENCVFPLMGVPPLLSRPVELRDLLPVTLHGVDAPELAAQLEQISIQVASLSDYARVARAARRPEEMNEPMRNLLSAARAIGVDLDWRPQGAVLPVDGNDFPDTEPHWDPGHI